MYSGARPLKSRPGGCRDGGGDRPNHPRGWLAGGGGSGGASALSLAARARLHWCNDEIQAFIPRIRHLFIFVYFAHPVPGLTIRARARVFERERANRTALMAYALTFRAFCPLTRAGIVSNRELKCLPNFISQKRERLVSNWGEKIYYASSTKRSDFLTFSSDKL